MERYQLVERIGAGRTGVVWRAFDLDLEELIALKILHPALASDEHLRAAVRRELLLASHRVTHPGLVRYYEFGRSGETTFLTMEHIAGESAAAVRARAGRLPLARIAPLARSLCGSLAAAHAAGLVHGDLKPADVLIHPTRGPVLTDVGVARALAEARDADDDATLSPYLPPEQLLGEEPTPAADVHALAALLFELLAGTPPWQGHDLATRLDRDPDLQTLAPDLPDAWLRLFTDCLRRDPAQRPRDARAMLARLPANPVLASHRPRSAA